MNEVLRAAKSDFKPDFPDRNGEHAGSRSCARPGKVHPHARQ
jgi:hypothetical protein